MAMLWSNDYESSPVGLFHNIASIEAVGNKDYDFSSNIFQKTDLAGI